VKVVRSGSLEAAARDARYSALASAAADMSLRWIATAHTLDDQAETVLLRAIRGGGLEGIAPVRGVFVRPLLDVARDELRSWLSSEGLEWREDPTNADVRMERNWLRAEIMPLLRERRPGVAKVLARIASTARADEQALGVVAAEVLSRASVDSAGMLLPSDEIDALPEAVLTRVVRSALRRMGADPSWTEIDDIRGGSRVECGDITVWRLREGIALMREPPMLPEPIELPRAGTVDAIDWGVRLRLGTGSPEPWRWRCRVPSDSPLTLRGRRPGDRVVTVAGTRKIQDVLVDAKISRPLRDFVPVVASDESAIAVVGLTPGVGTLVVDAEPITSEWSLNAPWSRASS
jgi:tRNA(Ile)-lysidine synthase